MEKEFVYIALDASDVESLTSKVNSFIKAHQWAERTIGNIASQGNRVVTYITGYIYTV